MNQTPYQSSVEEPTKMQPCNYDSLNGKEIILDKNPGENQQLNSIYKKMAMNLSQNGYPLIKIKPSLTAGNLSFKYSEYGG